jgi:hypothetical protein
VDLPKSWRLKLVTRKINNVCFREFCEPSQREIRPRRQCDLHDGFGQHTRARRGGSEMCDGTVDALIDRETTANITDPAYVVIPVHRIAPLRLGQPPPVLDRVDRSLVKGLVTEVCGLQHDRRRASYEAVLGHGCALRDGQFPMGIRRMVWADLADAWRLTHGLAMDTQLSMPETARRRSQHGLSSPDGCIRY